MLDIQQAHTGLSIRHRFVPDTEVLAAVLDNRFELGLVTLPPADARLTVSRFAEEPLELVARGLGFSVLPRYARLAFSKPESIQVIDGAPLVVDTLWLLHRAEWPLTARSETVLKHLKSHF